MQRTKSIFFKYFYICSAVILTSFVCLGAVLLLVSSQYFTGEKRDSLESNLTKALTEARTAFRKDNDWDGRIKSVEKILKNYSAATNADFYVCSQDGEILISSIINKTDEQSDNKPAVTDISADFLETVGDTPVYIRSDIDSFFSENRHNVAQKFQDANGTILYIIASAPVSQQDESVSNMLRLFLISAVIVLIICVIVVYVATIRLTAPIKEMADIANKIGQGDFSSQLPEYEITEFQELGAAINDMATAISSYDKMRTSFVANVSHELRTPMTSIGGFVDGIIDGTIPPEQHRKYLGLVSGEIKRLTRLVKSMLNLTKIESGAMKPDMQMIDIIQPIASTLFSFEDRINAKNVDIRGLEDKQVPIYADNDLVHQVVYNLIENAIKFVNVDGYIEFSFETQGDFTEVSIANSGEGLDENELPLVFDRFYKADPSRSLDATGVGLGLNIVKSIVKLHGGKISVTSVKGEYTKFIIQFKNKAE